MHLLVDLRHLLFLFIGEADASSLSILDVLIDVKLGFMGEMIPLIIFLREVTERLENDIHLIIAVALMVVVIYQVFSLS